MKEKDKIAWREKNKRINKDYVIKLGDRVVNSDGHKGVVVKINIESEDHHGTVYVWQEDIMNYGNDNCEHYCYNNWHEFLRVI